MGEQPPSRSPKPTAIKIVLACMEMSFLLANERPDAVEILVLVTGLVATVQHADVALPVNDDGAGHALHVVGLADGAVLVIDDREADRRLQTSQEAFSVLRVRLHIHANQREAHP